MSAADRGCDQPFVCDKDAEWVLLAHGKFPQGDVHLDREKVPPKERDG